MPKKPPLYMSAIFWINQHYQELPTIPFAAHELLDGTDEESTGSSRKEIFRILSTLQSLGLVVRMPHGYHYRHWRVLKNWPDDVREVLNRYVTYTNLRQIQRGVRSK